MKLDAPTPRVRLGIALRGIARSAIDVSDGLIADLGHICERSRVAADVQLEHVPVSAIVKRHFEHPVVCAAVLAGGDDYELVFTAARARRGALDRLARRLRLKLTRIGGITPRRTGVPRVTVLDSSGRPIAVDRGGYEHF